VHAGGEIGIGNVERGSQFAQISGQFVEFDIPQIHDEWYAKGLQFFADWHGVVALNDRDVGLQSLDREACRFPGKPCTHHRVPRKRIDHRALAEQLHLGARLEAEDTVSKQSRQDRGFVTMLAQLLDQMMRARLNTAAELWHVAGTTREQNFHDSRSSYGGSAAVVMPPSCRSSGIRC